MTKKKIPVGVINTATSLLLQIIAILNGFIIPKLILNTYGSEVNGLISSLSQFLNYVSLLEGGVNSVIMASLYGPLVKKDFKKIDSIVYTSTKFFRRISFVFVVYTIILAFIYPIISQSNFSFTYISTLTAILSVKLFTQYCFSLSYQNLLNASKNSYIISLSKCAIVVLDIILAIIITTSKLSVHVLEFASVLVYSLQPIIFSYAVRKKFKLPKEKKEDKTLIKNRWDGLSINIAYFIHSNTDITLLTIFTNLATVSIYSVHMLICGGITKVIGATITAISPSIGNIYASGKKEELLKKFNLYEYISFFCIGLLFGLGALLITPFIQLYTSNITDANYYQPTFAILLIISETIYMLRSPYANLAYAAGKFKDITKHAYIEAVINITLSIILINQIGMIGIVIGTIAAMTYRTLFQIIYLKNHILYRNFTIFIKRFIAFFAPVIMTIALLKISIPARLGDVYDFIYYSLIYSGILMIVQVIISYIFFKEDLSVLKHYLKRK
ncbi:polysaccharide biosynthesis C-terminal domain-containing protein [Candidatus Saccharibacteria bacterium]|nr:polysaccharide biosynthesis C-terminal domain-containing protein [Candidatus Saccharibacteria bacterium]